MIYLCIAQNLPDFSAQFKSLYSTKIYPLIYCQLELAKAFQYVKNIDQVILINLEGVQSDPDFIRKYIQKHLSSIQTKAKPQDITEKIEVLFQNMKVFNYSQFGFKATPIDAGNIFPQLRLDPLITHINNEPVFSVDTHPSIPILHLQILSGIKNLTLWQRSYKKVTFNGGQLYPNVYVKSFFEFSKLYPSDRSANDSLERVPKFFSECISGSKALRVFSKVYSDILEGDFCAVAFIGTDYGVMNLVIDEFENNYGSFHKQNGSGNLDEKCHDSKRLYIYNAESLHADDINRLISRFAASNTCSRLILHANISEEFFDYIGVKAIILPSVEQLDSVYPKLLALFINKLITKNSIGHLSQQEIAILAQNSVSNIFKIIPNLEKIREEFELLLCQNNFGAHNFTDNIFLWEYNMYLREKYLNDTSYRKECNTILISSHDQNNEVLNPKGENSNRDTEGIRSETQPITDSKNINPSVQGSTKIPDSVVDNGTTKIKDTLIEQAEDSRKIAENDLNPSQERQSIDYNKTSVHAPRLDGAVEHVDKAIVFHHSDGALKWIITCYGLEEELKKKYSARKGKDFEGEFIERFTEEDYNQNLPLKYIAFLVHYCKNDTDSIAKKIGVNDLYKRVRIWNKTVRGKKGKATANNIDGQIKDFFDPGSDRNVITGEVISRPSAYYKMEKTKFREQLGILIQEYFIFGKECYFHPKGKIKILIDDQDKRFPPM